MVASDSKLIFNRIVIGCDHAGFQLKQQLLMHIQNYGDIAVNDVGSYDDNSTNYPAVAHLVAQSIKDNPGALGILICGTGIGMCMTVNRYPFIRGALIQGSVDQDFIETAMLARQHNDANVLCLGGRPGRIDYAIQAVKIFLTTAFMGGRHQDRLDLMNINQ